MIHGLPGSLRKRRSNILLSCISRAIYRHGMRHRASVHLNIVYYTASSPHSKIPQPNYMRNVSSKPSHSKTKRQIVTSCIGDRYAMNSDHVGISRLINKRNLKRARKLCKKGPKAGVSRWERRTFRRLSIRREKTALVPERRDVVADFGRGGIDGCWILVVKKRARILR